MAPIKFETVVNRAKVVLHPAVHQLKNVFMSNASFNTYAE